MDIFQRASNYFITAIKVFSESQTREKQPMETWSIH